MCKVPSQRMHSQGNGAATWQEPPVGPSAGSMARWTLVWPPSLHAKGALASPSAVLPPGIGVDLDRGLLALGGPRPRAGVEGGRRGVYAHAVVLSLGEVSSACRV